MLSYCERSSGECLVSNHTPTRRGGAVEHFNLILHILCVITDCDLLSHYHKYSPVTGVIIIIVSGMKACLVPVVGGRGEG